MVQSKKGNYKLKGSKIGYFETSQNGRGYQEDTAGIFNIENLQGKLEGLDQNEIAKVLENTVKMMSNVIKEKEEAILGEGNASGNEGTVGSTFVGSLVYKGRIYTASLGDSSAFLVDKEQKTKKVTVKRLNTWDKLCEDGKPNAKEFKRVLDAGGRIRFNTDEGIFCIDKNSKCSIEEKPPYKITATDDLLDERGIPIEFDNKMTLCHSSIEFKTKNNEEEVNTYTTVRVFNKEETDALIVTGALGDTSYPTLKRTPQVTITPINDNSQYIISMSDGITDGLNKKQLLNEKLYANNNTKKTAKQLFKQSIRNQNERKGKQYRSRIDNTSIVVVDLKKVPKDCPVLTFVADGHGGDAISNWVAENFKAYFKRALAAYCRVKGYGEKKTEKKEEKKAEKKKEAEIVVPSLVKESKKKKISTPARVKGDDNEKKMTTKKKKEPEIIPSLVKEGKKKKITAPAVIGSLLIPSLLIGVLAPTLSVVGDVALAVLQIALPNLQLQGVALGLASGGAVLLGLAVVMLATYGLYKLKSRSSSSPSIKIKKRDNKRNTLNSEKINNKINKINNKIEKIKQSKIIKNDNINKKDKLLDNKNRGLKK